MATLFDGDNLIITLNAGGALHTVDVQNDLYSDWKEWMLLVDNQKYPPAFRAIGGDELIPGLNAGSYYFLQNQAGWRMRPAEEDSNISFIGSLIAEDSALAIMVPTLGAFSVIINGLQPITQLAGGAGVTAQQVWDYVGSSAVDKEDDLAKARLAAENAFAVSA